MSAIVRLSPKLPGEPDINGLDSFDIVEVGEHAHSDTLDGE